MKVENLAFARASAGDSIKPVVGLRLKFQDNFEINAATVESFSLNLPKFCRSLGRKA